MNYIGHFKTITEHKVRVMRDCFCIGLYKQGLLHDLSKYSPTEFLRGAKYYQGDRSPNNKEREETGMSLAWLHHKGRNKHHFEYWIDYSGDRDCKTVLEGIEMPRRYVAEMIIDRINASKVYAKEEYNQSYPLMYFMKSKKNMWFINRRTLAQMEFLLRMLDERGERYLFSYMKHVFLKKK